MQYDQYSNREIDLLFKQIDAKLDLIHTQTLKTNGRVTQAEEDIESLNLTRAENKGSWRTVAVGAAGISTLFWFLMDKFIPGK